MIRFSPKAFIFALVSGIATMSIFAGSMPNGDGLANQAKNLARMNCGAQIECITPDGHVVRVTPAAPENSEAAALIMDDDTVSCSLAEGETNIVIALPNPALLDRFTFLNENAAAHGELSIAVSNYRLPAKSAKWTPVEGTVAFTNKRTFDLSLLGVEAKFVRLTFRVQKEGRIAALGLYGQQSLDQFGARQGHVMQVSNAIDGNRPADRVNFNFANAYARAHVRFVSSGVVVDSGKMIDDDPITAYTFSFSDPHPTVVVELSAVQRLHRVSAIYDMHAGRLDVYALNKLTGDVENFDGLKPIASVVDHAGEGKASVDFNPQGAHYIALRWTPENSRAQHESFRIAEINAFGNVPLALLDMNMPPQLFANSGGFSTGRPGDGAPDLSNTLGTLAVPPTLPPVSP
jgi:hypothetical protein